MEFHDATNEKAQPLAPPSALPGEVKVKGYAQSSTGIIFNGVYSIKSEEARTDEIMKDLTIKYLDYFDKSVSIKLYERDIANGRWIVPRLYGVEKYGLPQRVSLSYGDAVEYPPAKYKLLDYQEACSKHMFENYFTKAQVDAGVAGAICDLPCGRGKTWQGMDLIVRVGKRALVVCHSNISLNQWKKLFNRIFEGEIVVSEYHGGPVLPAPSSGDVVVTTIHAVTIHREKTEAFTKWMNTFGTIVYDEIHLYGSPEFAIIFNLAPARVQLGLSATPDRSDSRDMVYVKKIGPIIDTQSKLGITAPKFSITVHLVDPGVTVPNIRHDNYAEMVKSITINETRAKVLANKITPFLIGKCNTLIFCNYIEEVDHLFPILIGLYPNLKIGKIYSNMTADEVSANADTCNILLCTYKKGGTAFDPTRFTVCVIWSPTRAMIAQAKGRIERWVDGNPEWNKRRRYIIDFIDSHTVCATQYYAKAREFNKVVLPRCAIYKKSGYDIQSPKNAAVKASEEERAKRENDEYGLSDLSKLSKVK